MSSIEERIRQAMQEGKFDNLPGAGKPLRLDENPHDDPEWRLAHHLLRSSGFSLPWIERRKEIELELQAARTALQCAWRWRVAETARGGLSQAAEAEWQRACSVFRQEIQSLNKKILTYNLEAPSERFHLRLVNPEREPELTAGNGIDRRELDLTVVDHSDTLTGTDKG